MDLLKSHPLWTKRDYLLTGNPLPDPGHNCAFLDTAGEHTWQSSPCSRKLGYICHKDGTSPAPPQSKRKTHEILQCKVTNAVPVFNDPCLTSSSCRFFPPQLSKGFVPTPGFPTMATAFTSIVLLKHGPMLRKSAAKKEETSSASTMWRSRALSFLSLDLVCKKHKITNIALLFPSFFIFCTVVLSLAKTSVKPFVNTISWSNTFSLSAASNDELWIGFNDIRTEGLFDWSDHSSVSFTSWTFGKPSVSTDAEDCVLITGEVREVM